MTDVGLNGLLLESPLSGTATYTRNLVPLLPGAGKDFQYTLYVRRGKLPDPRIRQTRLSSPLDSLHGTAGQRASKLVWEEVVLPLASASRGDVLLHYLYFASPIIARAPVVVTVHDIIPLVVPGYHRSRQSSLYARLMARTVTRAAAVITVSTYSKMEIHRILGVREERIHVTYEAADERFVPCGTAGELADLRRRYALPEQFVLYLGGAERRKGIETLVRAWHMVAGEMRHLGISLVVVARFPPADALYPDIPRLARELELGNVTFVPFVTEEDKPALYRAAVAFAFPSRYEGFGLTPLEAMASGTPVVASRATSIPEVTGDAALLLPPDDVHAWARTLLDVIENPALRADLREKGIERARNFSWRRTAEETVAVYRRVLGA